VIAALTCAVALMPAACSSSSERQVSTTTSGRPPAAATSQPPSANPDVSTAGHDGAAEPATRVGNPVYVSLYEDDGQMFGVAMPIIAYFSRAITDASVFVKVITVTVDGTPVEGAWYFEHSSQASQALEAHYRTATYWPAHTSIKVSMPPSRPLGGNGSGVLQQRDPIDGQGRRADRRGQRQGGRRSNGRTPTAS
jgi:guanyl-specific ribonuclease Sa